MAPVIRKAPKVKSWYIKDEPINQQSQKESQEDINSILVKFITKQPQYAVPPNAISLKENSDVNELNFLMKSILTKDDSEKEVPEFDFLIDGEVLVSSLRQLIGTENFSRETVFEVEYLERKKPPKPTDSLKHDDWVSSVSNSNKILLTGCYDKTVQLWDASFLETGKGKKGHILTIPAHKAAVKAVAWIKETGPDRLFVSCSMDQTAIVWSWNAKDPKSAKRIWKCKGHTQSIECVASDPSSRRFATGSWDYNLKVWDGDPSSSSGIIEDDPEPKTKKAKQQKQRISKAPLMTLAGHSEGISGVDWINKNQLYTCSWDHSMRLWDLEEAKSVRSFSGNVSFLCTSYSKKNQMIISGCADRFIRLYDPRSEAVIMHSKYGNHQKWVSSVKWHRNDENLFASGSYDTLACIWDKRSPKSAMYQLTGHTDKIFSVDWTDENHIATGSADCTAKVFSFER